MLPYCKVTEFGAVGDNKTEDTTAIQKSLDSCLEVVFPAPGKYLTKSLFLKTSNQVVNIEKGSMVIAWGEISSWNATKEVFPIFGNNGTEMENVTIRGSGIVDGQGWRWWPFGPKFPRPKTFQFSSVTNFVVQGSVSPGHDNPADPTTFEGLTIRDSPAQNVVLAGRGLLIEYLRVEAGLDSCAGYFHAPNTDAFNVHGSDVVVRHSWSHNGDDCVPVFGPATNITAYDVHCECGTNGGVVILGTGSSELSNVSFSNFTVIGTNQGAGAKIGNTEQYPNGAIWKNISFHDYRIINPRYAGVYINVEEEDSPTCTPPKSHADPWLTAHGFHFENLSINLSNSTAFPGCLKCVPENPCTNITFANALVSPQNSKSFTCYNAQTNATNSFSVPCQHNPPPKKYI